MINILQLTCIAFCVTFLVGCGDNTFEDKDMTQAFIQKYQNELNIIEEFENTRTYKGAYPEGFDLSYKPKGESYIDEKYVNCNDVISLKKQFFGNYSLSFREEDIVKYGKTIMFQKAEECFVLVVSRCQRDRKSDELRNERLNEKFVLPKNEDGNVSGKENQK